MLALAGQPVPDGGAWLWVTAAEPQPGRRAYGLVPARYRPAACGGDVLVHLAPGRHAGRGGGGEGAGLGGRGRGAGPRRGLGPGQPGPVAGDRPQAVVFAMGALTELEEHGADICAREQVEVIAAAGSVPAGFPALPTRVNAGG